MLATHLGELAALAVAFFWTMSALAFEAAGRRVGSLAVNLLRLAIGLALLSLYCLWRRGSLLPGDASAEAWLWLSLSGLVGLTFGDLCLFRAYLVVGVRLSMLVMSLAPPLTALLGWLVMGERLSGLQWLGMLLTIGGVSWVVAQRQAVSASPAPPAAPATPQPSRAWGLGLLLALGGAVGQALGLVLSKHGMGSYDAFAATQIRIIAGLAGFCVLVVAGRRLRLLRAALADRRALGLLSVGALFGPFLGISFSLLAVQHTSAGVAATLMALVPILIIPAVIVVHRERVPPRAWLGTALAVAGSALLFL